MSSGEVLLLGDINIDTVLPVAEFPMPGRDGLAPHISTGIGGAVVNSAFVLQHLGQRTALLGCVGADVWAEKVKQDVGQTTIKMDYVKSKPQHCTGLTFIIATPDGERTMFSHRGVNTQLAPQDIDEKAFPGAGMLHISGYALLESPQKEAVWRAVELAKQNQVPVSLDTGLDPVVRNPDEVRRLLPALTLCITGLKEMEILFGDIPLSEAVDAMLASGVRLVAIKLGDKGCHVFGEAEKISYPAFQVNALDTTGAGDSFTSGLIYGWLQGMGLLPAAALASALGALATTVYGAGSALPAKGKVVDFLRTVQDQSIAGEIEELLGILEKNT
ncbi:MAG TPA: carbohydrate kinase family protein [Anaerolineaceae bacterium]|jgi:ribokinase|nr:carbohydrate kinase family protein [Anaerolineaceae bacterium]